MSLALDSPAFPQYLLLVSDSTSISEDRGSYAEEVRGLKIAARQKAPCSELTC